MGGEASNPTDAGLSVTPSTTTTDAQTQATESPADEPATTDAPAEEPAPGSVQDGITLTIGTEIWDFEGAFCAFQNAPAGEEGSEWNVSWKQGDLQVYINDDSFGPSISITDVVNFGSFEWVGEGAAISLSVDGNDITAEGTFTDGTGVEPPTEGALAATCADWVSG